MRTGTKAEEEEVAEGSVGFASINRLLKSFPR